jgi:hypothetical protein
MLSSCCFCIIFAIAPHALQLFFISSHIYAYTLDRDEPELEEPPEQVQAEDTNIGPKQGNTGASNPILEFCLSLYLNYESLSALNCRS